MAKAEIRQVVSLWLRKAELSWYGVAEFEGALVATSAAETEDEASRILIRCLPAHAPYAAASGDSAFADRTARMLAAIEGGDESGKRFTLSPRWVPEPAASVYRLVAAIPLGYASSYGRIAAKAGTIARDVGRLMANNPLYPLVPCHRVVGSDYSLVGYRGAKDGPDLDDKLARLRAEARGYGDERALEVSGGLVIFPVERVIARAERRRAAGKGQLALF